MDILHTYKHKSNMM